MCEKCSYVVRNTPQNNLCNPLDDKANVNVNVSETILLYVVFAQATSHDFCSGWLRWMRILWTFETIDTTSVDTCGHRLLASSC